MENYFKSANGVSSIYYKVWECENPKAVVQIIHGMKEDINRYNDFAKYLNSRNYLVAGIDMQGHGNSCKKEDMGHFQGDYALDSIKDVEKLRCLVGSKYNLPYYFLGHSMGSIVLRNIINRGEVDKAVIMGTGYFDKIQISALKYLSKLIKVVKGQSYKSELLRYLTTGKYNKGVNNSWLSYNEENIQKYNEAGGSISNFTATGFIALSDFALKATKSELQHNFNRETPMLIVSGAEDPLGGSGKAVIKVYEDFIDAKFKRVEIKLFENMKHEILMEKDRRLVYKYITDFLDR